MSDRIAYLANIRRPLTVEEDEEFAEYFDRIDEDESEATEAIGGRDYPMALFTPADDDMSDTDSDASDFDGNLGNTEPLQDIHFEELVTEIQNGNMDEDEEMTEQDVVPEAAIEPNRGEKYIGQGKRNDTVWWSMPSSSEKERTQVLRRNRIQSAPSCKETFTSKQAAFKRLFSTEIIENVVLETNRKARRAYANNDRQDNPRTMRNWQDTNVDEIYAFLGILIYAGAEKSNLVQVKDLFHKSHMPFYRAVMSLKRFEQLSRFLRFDDSRTRADRLRQDKLAPIRHIWTLFHENLSLPFIPSKELTIDEQLLSSRNRCSFRQYIPSKPGKYGIKIFWLVDATTNYPVSGEIYLGTQPNEERSGGISHDLVLRLARRYLDTGSNITMDNFFTSYKLAKDLCDRNTTLVGTVRANKRELPKLFTSKDEAKKRGAYSSVFCFSDEVSLVSYTSDSKKNVLLMSTAHATEEINEDTRKPVIIHDYNKHKGGVDTFDKMLRGFTCKRKSNRWPLALFYNMVDVAALAAFRLYELCHPGWNKNKSEKRKTFLKELALELVQSHLDTRSKLPLKASVKTAMELIDYKRQHETPAIPTKQVNKLQRRCEMCKSSRTKKKDTKTTAVCDLCLKPTCANHYIRTCEQCHVHNYDTAEDSDDLHSGPSTSQSVPRPTPARGLRTSSPVNI